MKQPGQYESKRRDVICSKWPDDLLQNDNESGKPSSSTSVGCSKNTRLSSLLLVEDSMKTCIGRTLNCTLSVTQATHHKCQHWADDERRIFLIWCRLKCTQNLPIQMLTRWLWKSDIFIDGAKMLISCTYDIRSWSAFYKDTLCRTQMGLAFVAGEIFKWSESVSLPLPKCPIHRKLPHVLIAHRTHCP